MPESHTTRGTNHILYLCLESVSFVSTALGLSTLVRGTSRSYRSHLRISHTCRLVQSLCLPQKNSWIHFLVLVEPEMSVLYLVSHHAWPFGCDSVYSSPIKWAPFRDWRRKIYCVCQCLNGTCHTTQRTTEFSNKSQNIFHKAACIWTTTISTHSLYLWWRQNTQRWKKYECEYGIADYVHFTKHNL